MAYLNRKKIFQVVKTEGVKTEETETELAMADGDQVLTPAEGVSFSKVTIKKPATLVAENIAKNVNIGGVVGTLSAGAGQETLDGLIDGNVVEIKSNVATLRSSVFQSLKLLESVDFPLVTSIAKNQFLYCTGLKSANFPQVTSVGETAFNQCSKLENVALPLITSLGQEVFGSCSSLRVLDFPLLTSLKGGYIFYNCSSLTTLILRSTTMATLGSTAVFQGTPIARPTATGFIYVPDELVESYKVATNWATYASKIKGLSELPSE